MEIDTQQPVDAQPNLEAPPEPEAPTATGVIVEIVMDSFRVNGELFAPGVPRRLVDILNSNDMTYFIMNSARSTIR